MSSGHEVSAAERGSTLALQRAVTAFTCAAAALALLAAGPFAPVWITRLGAELDVDAERSLRFAAGVLLAAAIGAIVMRRTARVAIGVGCGLLFFSGLATLSGFTVHGWPTLVAGAVAALVAGVISPSLLRSAPPRSRVSLAWPILGGMAVVTGSLALTARAPVRSATVRPLITETTNQFASAPSINFDLPAWEHRPLAETGLFEHLPELAPLTQGPLVYVVFYNSHCGHCHDLFHEFFSGALPQPVIAVELPPVPGATMAESDQPEAIDCPQCQRLSLPLGKLWSVTPPAILRVEYGIVTCAREGKASDCLVP
ncbi:MAG: hypothetical protein SGJ11_05885 [Phycisphaerae bacterium]|nr:hypothetical protein [Phycisphaerae bacterium]